MTSVVGRGGALAWLLGLVVATYFLAYPLQPSQSDEGAYLYGAQRLLAGDVLYRDFFEFITPGAMYFFAGVFALTGPSLLAARVATAAVNGLSAALIFRLARHVAGVVEAFAAGLVFAAVCLPVWRQASPHWLSTCSALATAAVVLGERGSSDFRAAAAGACVAVTACIHQHHGVFIGVGLLVALGLLASLAPAGKRRRLWARQVAWAAGVGGIIVGAVLGYSAWRASVDSVVYALFTFVFKNYRPQHAGTVRWAGWFWMSADGVAYTWAWLLRWMPVALVVETASLVWRLRTVRGRDEVVRGCLLLLAVVMGASVLYYPDYIHVAFIAPFMLVVVARVVHALLGRVPVARVAFAAILLVAVVVKGGQNLSRAWTTASVRVDSPVGTLDLSPGQRALLDTVRGVVGTGRPLLFSYPGDAWLYFVVPAENATPYSILLPRYNTAEQYATAIAAVEQRKVPYLVLLSGLLPTDDPVLGYARHHYEVAVDAFPYTIFRRTS